MDYPLSRAVLAASAGYGVFAAVKPRHLADNADAPPAEAPAWDRLAYTYAGRELMVCGLGLLGGTRAVPVAMGLRIASDLTDATVLGTTAPTDKARGKMLGITLGWAALNALALAVDRRRDG
jgi:hypothetical protein